MSAPPQQSVLFDSGSAAIKPEAASGLGEIAAYLDCDPSAVAVIDGHTDSVGTDASNVVLSQRRAEAVRANLVARGAPSERIRSSSHGETEPVADNDSAIGRQLNRRSSVAVKTAEGCHTGWQMPDLLRAGAPEGSINRTAAHLSE